MSEFSSERTGLGDRVEKVEFLEESSVASESSERQDRWRCNDGAKKRLDGCFATGCRLLRSGGKP